MDKKDMMEIVVRKWAEWVLEKTGVLVLLIAWGFALALLVG